jgi:hypothetical protein
MYYNTLTVKTRNFVNADATSVSAQHSGRFTLPGQKLVEPTAQEGRLLTIRPQ